MRAFLAIFVLSWICTLFLPWWALFLPGFFIAAWLLQSGSAAFLIGFASTGLAWFVQALYIHFANDAILSTRIAELMGLSSPWLVLLITFSAGGIPGALGALTGYLLKLNLKQPTTTETAQT